MFDQHEQFAKDLAQVAAIDFVNHKDIFMVGVVQGFLAKAIENPILQAKTACFTDQRAIATDEVIIRIGLVKLHHFKTLVIFFFHQGVGQFSGYKGFAHPWRPLQDHSLLGL